MVLTSLKTTTLHDISRCYSGPGTHRLKATEETFHTDVAENRLGDIVHCSQSNRASEQNGQQSQHGRLSRAGRAGKKRGTSSLRCPVSRFTRKSKSVKQRCRVLVSVFRKAAILATKSAINLKPSAGAEFKALKDLLSWKGSPHLVSPRAGRQRPAAILQSLPPRSRTL